MNARTKAQRASESLLRSAVQASCATAVALGMTVAASVTAAAPDAPGSRSELSVSPVDHSPWDRLLQRYVRRAEDGVNRFDYGAVETTDRAALDRYLAALQATAVTGLGRDAQMAFWINLYNAYTVKLVLDHYPVASIRDIPGGRGPSLAALFRFDTWASMVLGGPWASPIATVEGKRFSLNDIEHRVLRPAGAIPILRIHYAVNCASLSCPNLAPSAYTADNLEALLEGGARDYVNHPRGVRVEGGRAWLSSIYRWYDEDFGGSEEFLLAHLKRYAEPGLDAALERVHLDRMAGL